MGFTPYGSGFNAMSSIVPVIVVIGFAVVIGIIIVRLIKGGMEWSNNNNSPMLAVSAKVVTKRMAVRRQGNMHMHNSNMGMHHHSSSTIYFVTFEVESGDRIELKVPDKEYGMLVEGDFGELSFQGTRYKGFERNVNR